MKNKILKDTVAITLITLVSGLALGIVQEITAGPIARQEALSKERAYKEVFPEAASFETILSGEDESLEAYLDEKGYTAQNIDEVMQALDEEGSPLGYAFTVTSSEGYGGDIQFAMGVMDDGTVNGLSILSIDTEEFKSQFQNKNVEAFQYTKNGAETDQEIDAISGATITTNAMVNGVNAGLCAFQYEKGGN